MLNEPKQCICDLLVSPIPTRIWGRFVSPLTNFEHIRTHTHPDISSIRLPGFHLNGNDECVRCEDSGFFFLEGFCTSCITQGTNDGQNASVFQDLSKLMPSILNNAKKINSQIKMKFAIEIIWKFASNQYLYQLLVILAFSLLQIMDVQHVSKQSNMLRC